MKFLIDFFPVLLFFIAYKMADVYTATGILMLATVMQSLLIWRMEGRLHTMQKVTLALLEESERTKKTPQEIAIYWANEWGMQTHPIWGHRGLNLIRSYCAHH